MMNATAIFPTTKAERYLGTLCKHFGHKLPVTFDRASGQITFPFGQVGLVATDRALELRAEARDRAALDRTVDVITAHLERFAFREDPRLDWAMPGAAA